MDYSIDFDSNEYDMYLVEKRKLIIHTYDREYTLFKKEYGSYRDCGLVRKKDFNITPKNKLKNHILVRFDYYNELRVELIKRNELEKYIKKHNALEETLTKKDRKAESERKELQDLKDDLKVNRSTLQKLLQVDEEKLEKGDLIKFNNFLISITEKLKTGINKDSIEIKETKSTMMTNKNSRVSLYKSKIDNYMKEGKYQSINRLCKDLKINRQTFYNYGLDEYIKLINK